MDDSDYETVATEILERVAEKVEDDFGDHFDVDFQDGILTIDLDDGRTYVLNKHAPNQQIWLSSPLSGASHFKYEPTHGWISTRGKECLLDMLAEELLTVTGRSIRF